MARHSLLAYLNRAALTTAGMCIVSPAAAQNMAAAPEVPSQADASDASQASPDPQNDIVVVASKTGEPLDRAPIAAITLDGDQLTKLHVESVRDAQIRLPSLVYNDSGGSAQAYIRGIGTNSAYAGLESSIGTYEDGVYLQRQVGASVDVVDLRSIDVLNGPQGSLYGRNATGGVILINTNDPVQEFTGSIKGTYGNLGRAEGEAVLNVPLTSDLALRVAGRFSHLDGYVHNIANGDRLGGYDSGTVRGKLKWDPDARLSIVASVEYHKEVDDPVARRLLTGAPACTACAVFGATPSPADEFYQVSQTKTRDTSIRYLAGTLNVKYVGDTFDVISVTGVRDFHYKVFVDQDYAAPDLFRTRAEEYGTTLTEDTYVRTHFDGAFNFLLGVSGEIDKDTLVGELDGIAFGPLSGATNVASVRLQSISPYGEAYMRLPSNFKLTVGGRYNIDNKKLHSVSDAAGVAAVGAVPDFRESVTYRDFTPRVVLSHETARTTVYASYSKGAKSGGYNTPAFTPIVPLRPEKLTSYEVGIKARSADGAISVSGAGFYYDYKDIQVSFVDAASGAVQAENAARARVYGMELNASLRILKGLTLSAGGLLEHGRFLDYPSAAIFCPNDVVSSGYPGCPPPIGAPGLVGGSADLAGAPLPRAPQLSYSLAADYEVPVSNGWVGEFSAADRYTSTYDLLPGAGGPLGLSRQPAYHFLTASIGVKQRDSGLEVRAFVTNLSNSKYYLDLPTSAFGVAGSAAAPRSYGMSIGYSF